MKMLRIVELMWLAIAAISVYETYYNWADNRERSYMFLAFLGLAIFMYFLRRRTRTRYQNRNENNPES